MPDNKRILVIKHGALGDFVLATGPFKAIRGHHPRAHVTLMTSPAFAALGRDCGWFDAVWEDARPRPWNAPAWLALARRLRGAGFERVYDLQNSDRTRVYFWLLGRRRREWSGIAPGCSHPHRNSERGGMHTLARQAEQLGVAGIEQVPAPDLSWAGAGLDRFALDGAFALVVPGGAAHRPQKRWPAARYTELCPSPLGPGHAAGTDRRRVRAGGARRDRRRRAGFARSLRPHELFRNRGPRPRARLAVGNDTGPMHLIAATGCPSLVLFSAASDPARTAPVGDHVTVLRRPSLGELPLDAVCAALRPR